MNHLFWLWAGGFIAALASVSIATDVFRLKATLRSVLFELVTLIFWPILGARRRLPPRTRDMYRGDPVLADIVDELDRALEIVGQVKPGRRRK